MSPRLGFRQKKAEPDGLMNACFVHLILDGSMRLLVPRGWCLPLVVVLRTASLRERF